MIHQKTKGSIVTVYEQPLTQTKKEGSAELIKRIPNNRDDETVENWKVMFCSDAFICEKLINKSDLKVDLPYRFA